MSKAKRRLKAQRRRAEYMEHGARKVFPCIKCGAPGPHFVPPSLGDAGFYLCAYMKDIPEEWG